jgi:hypothetical protein
MAIGRRPLTETAVWRNGIDLDSEPSPHRAFVAAIPAIFDTIMIMVIVVIMIMIILFAMIIVIVVSGHARNIGVIVCERTELREGDRA